MRPRGRQRIVLLLNVPALKWNYHIRNAAGAGGIDLYDTPFFYLMNSRPHAPRQNKRIIPKNTTNSCEAPDRCRFADHMPTSKLAFSFQKLYGTYFEVTAKFSLSEKHRLLHDTGAKVYGLAARKEPVPT